jgi:HSP20 family protein
MNKLVRFDPFRELDTLQRQLFSEDWTTQLKSLSFPTTDIYTNDDSELIVEAHLPKFSDEDININVDDGALIIQAEKHEKEEDKKRKYVVRESSSSFYRRIQLPERANSDKIAAKLDDGILKVTIPLVALPEPKKISIESKSK